MVFYSVRLEENDCHAFIVGLDRLNFNGYLLWKTTEGSPIQR